MYNKKLISLAYITLFSTGIYGKILSKDEVLKQKGTCDWKDCTGVNYYCKGDICAEYDFNSKSLEFPNNEGKMENYIVDTCSSTAISTGQCNSEKCTADSQCLSNKCENNHCAFNEITPVVFCQDIYRYNGTLIMEETEVYCGKPYGDSCKSDSECSSKYCFSGICEEERIHQYSFNEFKTLSKEEVLKLELCKDKNSCSDFPEYYCKDDICSQPNTQNYYSVEIPNKEGNLVNYIHESCTTGRIDSGECKSKKCSLDSQCLSNKCYKNHCAYNEVTPVVHCSSVSHYNTLLGSTSHKMKCGKAINDVCKSNSDCSTDYCGNDGICDYQPDHEGQFMSTIFIYVILGGCVIFLLPIGVCLCLCLKPKKNKESSEKSKDASADASAV